MNKQKYESLSKEDLIQQTLEKDVEIERLTRLSKGQEKELSALETSFALRVGRKIDDLTAVRHTVRRVLQRRRRKKRAKELERIRNKRAKVREREKARRLKLREKQKRERERRQQQRGGGQNQPSFWQKLRIKASQWRAHLQRDHSIPILPKKSYQLANVDFSTLKVATILDEFSYNCFKYEMDLHPLSIHDTIHDLETIQPNLLLVESAWKGSSGQWKIGLASNYNKMVELTNYCKTHDIPTIFWCKEDPVHFEHFLPLAQMFDYVFTTDSNMVPHYKRECGHEDCYALPFAAQPSIHNPIQTIPRESKVCFAGSYYRNKYHDRSRILCEMLRASQTVGVDIYDRNYESGIEHYLFPEEFENEVKGVLPYDQIEKAYKGYRVNLNVNTVTNSPTMFSRRVFESLACHTPMLSNYAEGTEKMFGDLINMSEDVEEYRQHLVHLFEDEVAYQRLALLGLRRVLKEHTYRHRVMELLKPLGIKVPLKRVRVAVLSYIQSEEELNGFIEQVTRQKLVLAEGLAILSSNLKVEDLTVKWPTNVAWVSEEHFSLKHSLFDQVDEVTCFSPSAFYGDYYLHDLTQTRLYQESPYVMKGANLHIGESKEISFEVKTNEYQFNSMMMDLTRGMAKREAITFENIQQGLKHQLIEMETPIFVIDSFNFYPTTSDELKPLLESVVNV